MTQDHELLLPKATDTPEPEAPTYEPPKVESVLTAEELAREIQYAGVTVLE